MAGKPAETHLRDTVSVMMGVSKGEVKTKLKKGALRMKQFERPSNEKGGAPQGEVHNDEQKRKWVIENLQQLSPEELEDFFSQVLRLELRKPLKDHPLLALLSMSQE